MNTSLASRLPTTATAVFNTPIGEFAPVTETQFGFHVILVTDEILEGTRGLDEVSEDIRRELKLRRAQEMTTERAAALSGQATTSALLETAAVEAGARFPVATGPIIVPPVPRSPPKRWRARSRRRRCRPCFGSSCGTSKNCPGRV